MIAIICFFIIVFLQSLCFEAFAQKSDSDESLISDIENETESKTESVFGTKNDSADDSQIHTLVKDQEKCGTCHELRTMEGTDISFVAFGENSGALMTVNCKGCHPQHLGDHPILVQPMFNVPKDLPLSKKGEVTCMTCHNTHYVRYSDRPWSPRSVKTKVLDYVFKKKEYKTYFLRRNNSKKELCISCHTGVRHQRTF
ncbi:multiheme c-type cytochrome [Candidatus Latescibacterota bacterium]